tara:strand:- start:1197 stop:2264 length:1068 start_codon:yes stop_codon:yes gene_type:complete
MLFKSSKILFIFLIIVTSTSCGLLKENNGEIKYKTTDFDKHPKPKQPTYLNLDDWLVHPKKKSELTFLNKNNGLMKVDVFFIVPTLFTDRKNINWNSDIYNDDFTNILMESSIKYQSTAWMDSGNLYSPNYRQAHFRVFDEYRWENGGEKAYNLAYEDIKRSFKIFLENYNQGKPIIIAGHSQGSGHAIRLLQDFFDGKELKSKLVAAYLPGTKVTKDDFFDLELMNSPDETGGFITWNTLKILKNEQKYNFTIDREWLADALCSNPITWDSKKNADYSKHKGLLFLNGKVFPNALKIDNIDTGVFLKTPKIGLLRTLLISTLKDYHKADINLFWEDIRQNSVLRAKAYFKNLAE